MAFLAPHGSYASEARRAGVASLDAVDAVDAAEQPIVVADRLPAKRERLGLEVFVVSREALLDGSAQDRLIARSGYLCVVGQSGGVLVDRLGHAERLRLARHQLGELVLRSGERLRHHDRGVVGGAGYHALDGVLDLDALTVLKAELGRRLVF